MVKARQWNGGFSLLELLLVVAVALIVAGIAIPNFLNIMHAARLKGAATDFAGLLQTARMRAEMDDRYYATYVLAGPPPQAYVDIFPQAADGTSGNGGTSIAANDPAIQIHAEVVQKAATSAPSTTALRNLILPATSTVVPADGGGTATPFTFSPRGLPCLASGGVCDSLGGAQARWIFFQDNITQAWSAVTVTPAGRIQRWLYTGGAGGTWAKY